jgi:cytochrome c1
MKRLPYFALASVLALSLVIVACSDDDDNTVTPPTEFVAAASDFTGFKSWDQPSGPHVGPDPAEIGQAHGALDSTLTRYIYLNNASAERGSNNQFPQGTIFVKQTVKMDGSVVATTGMAKRGAGFNATHNGWEWFLLNEDGTIAQRGAEIAAAPCGSCHSANADEDFVWAK